MINYTEKVAAFCKSNRTRGHRLGDLFGKFIEINPAYTDQWEFEKAMLSLRKTPAIKCRESCFSYAKKHGSDKWEDFCKEIDNISLAFWNDAAMIEVLPKAPLTVREDDSDAYERLMPNNWGIMTFSDRVDFMLKVQHEGFLKYILDKDAKLKKYYEGLRKKTDPKLKIYITLFSFDSKSYSKQSKDLIRNFVATLNNLGRAKLQYVECTNPDMVEIREVR